MFLVLLILFFITAPLYIFYSLGWRIDWQAKKIVQSGAFYFKVSPKSAEIYIDGKLVKKTDFLFGSFFLDKLLPGKRKIEIKKQGFFFWEKELEIKAKEVCEAKNISLILENPQFQILSKEIDDFFFSPDHKKIILKEKDKDGWSLKLFEIDKGLKSSLINKKDISKESVDLISLEFSLDSKRILMKLGLKENQRYYLLETDKNPSVLTALDFLESNVEKLYFHPKNSQKLLALAQPVGLVEIDLKEKKISPVLKENISACFISDNDIYYINKTGFIFKTDFSFSPGEKLNIIPFSIKQETPYEINVSKKSVFLKENETIFELNEKSKSFQKIFEPIKFSVFSPDSKKLAYSNDYEIWIIFLEKEDGQPKRKINEKLFLTRFSEKIGGVFWYNNHYLIFNVGDKIKIAEIDDRDKINIAQIAEFKAPEIFWNQNDKKLYFLSENNFYSSEKLIP